MLISIYELDERVVPQFLCVGGLVTLPPCRYNIGLFAVGISDLGLAYQAFKIAVSMNQSHAEAFTNLGVCT